MTPETRRETVAIIGAQGDWGQKADELYENAGFKNRIGSDLRNPNSPLAIDAINAAGIVQLDVAPDEIPQIIKAAGPAIFRGKKVIDHAGEKDMLIAPYTQLDEAGASICSTHPNCLPTQPLENQKIMIMKVGQNWQPATKVALEVHQEAGMIPFYLRIEDHDIYMDFNQYLTHLFNRTNAEARIELAARYGIDLNILDEISTANSTLSDLAMWRTAVQKPETSAQIVRFKTDNPRRGEFARTAIRLMTEISQTANPAELADRFRETVETLDPTGEKRKAKLKETTAILEELANLAAESVTVRIARDEVGALINVLIPFADAGINIGAIRSHRTNGAIEFQLGIKNIHQDTQTLLRLSQLLSAANCELLTEG